MDEKIMTPNELNQHINSLTSQIEGMAIAAMKRAGVTQVDFSLNHAIANNAVQEEEANILSATLDENDNTIRLNLDTDNECNWGYISDQTLENAVFIYEALWWELPEK